jgi:hypothetical protein
MPSERIFTGFVSNIDCYINGKPCHSAIPIYEEFCELCKKPWDRTQNKCSNQACKDFVASPSDIRLIPK